MQEKSRQFQKRQVNILGKARQGKAGKAIPEKASQFFQAMQGKAGKTISEKSTFQAKEHKARQIQAMQCKANKIQAMDIHASKGKVNPGMANPSKAR